MCPNWKKFFTSFKRIAVIYSEKRSNWDPSTKSYAKYFICHHFYRFVNTFDAESKYYRTQKCKHKLYNVRRSLDSKLKINSKLHGIWRSFILAHAHLCMYLYFLSEISDCGTKCGWKEPIYAWVKKKQNTVTIQSASRSYKHIFAFTDRVTVNWILYQPPNNMQCEHLDLLDAVDHWVKAYAFNRF